jgi:hypothetical protein
MCDLFIDSCQSLLKLSKLLLRKATLWESEVNILSGSGWLCVLFLLILLLATALGVSTFTDLVILSSLASSFGAATAIIAHVFLFVDTL